MRGLVVLGNSGTRLYVEEHGPPTGTPVVLLHGIGQCRRAWPWSLVAALATDLRVVLVDLRGHGASDAPIDGYDQSTTWAGDVAAVLDALRPAAPAVLVAWSYAGAVAADYLALHGTAGLRALCLVGATPDLGPAAISHLGPGFLAVSRRLLSTDPARVERAQGDFVDLLTAAPLPPGEHGRAVGWSEVIPPYVWSGMLRREVRHDGTLRKLAIPTLVVHGDADRVVLPSRGERSAALVPGATLARYAGVGHSPPREAPTRFLADLRALVATAEG